MASAMSILSFILKVIFPIINFIFGILIIFYPGIYLELIFHHMESQNIPLVVHYGITLVSMSVVQICVFNPDYDSFEPRISLISVMICEIIWLGLLFSWLSYLCIFTSVAIILMRIMETFLSVAY